MLICFLLVIIYEKGEHRIHNLSIITKIGNVRPCLRHTPGGGHIASASNVKNVHAHEVGNIPALQSWGEPSILLKFQMWPTT